VRPLKTDLSIFGKLNLDKPPVGVKYLYLKPEGIEQLDKSLALCEMLVEAQQRQTPFYITKDNETCFGKQALGMVTGGASAASSGEMGVRMEIFQDARANKKLYQYNPGLPGGTVNYVVFAPLEAITFEPDLLIFLTHAKKAEIILRAMTYSTGEIYESKTSTALSCAWLYTYPYLSGKVNYYITGLGFGSTGRQVFEPGQVLIAIPYNWLSTIADNLSEMKWELKGCTMGKEGFGPWLMEIVKELMQESQNTE
jgi:uncharacterized protein (DUF169 family)